VFYSRYYGLGFGFGDVCLGLDTAGFVNIPENSPVPFLCPTNSVIAMKPAGMKFKM